MTCHTLGAGHTVPSARNDLLLLLHPATSTPPCSNRVRLSSSGLPSAWLWCPLCGPLLFGALGFSSTLPFPSWTGIHVWFIFIFTPHFYLLVSASPSGIWKVLIDFEWMNNHGNDKTVLCRDAHHDFKSLHTFDFPSGPGLVLTCLRQTSTSSWASVSPSVNDL